MMDFLTFKSFISIEALIFFYYLGALIMPAGLWLFLIWITHRYGVLKQGYEKGKALVWRTLNAKQRTLFALFFAVAFLFAELFWRMLFEFLIAYMQMRDALLQSQL